MLRRGYVLSVRSGCGVGVVDVGVEDVGVEEKEHKSAQIIYMVIW